mgnify:CR=1 FL=1
MKNVKNAPHKAATHPVSTPLSAADYIPILQQALLEDLGTDDYLNGDITSTLTIPENKTAKAVFKARQNGVVAGLEVALTTFGLVDSTLKIETRVTDGDIIKAGDTLARVTGKARSILTAERVALNLLTHLCGIATATHEMVQLIDGTKAKLLDTRKTLPTLRRLQKYAVAVGGGVNHRFGLYDMIMIKDNHIAYAGGLRPALETAKAGKPDSVSIEVEVDTLEQLEELLEAGGADVVLLDNMPPATLKKAVDMVNGRLVTEASGNITKDTIRAVAETGVDYISSGALTHSVTNFDIGLDVQ